MCGASEVVCKQSIYDDLTSGSYANTGMNDVDNGDWALRYEMQTYCGK